MSGAEGRLIKAGRIGWKMYCCMCDIWLHRPDESSYGQKESALLSLINAPTFCPFRCFAWLVAHRDHLGRVLWAVSQNHFSWGRCAWSQRVYDLGFFCFCSSDKYWRYLQVRYINIKECSNVCFVALRACICMCALCMPCVRYYICLELLTPTDSESLPRGRWRENGKSTRELWTARREERGRRTVRQTERKGRRQTGNERRWEGKDDSVWPAVLSVLSHHVGCWWEEAGGEGGGNWWAAEHRPVTSAVLALTLCYAGNSVISSLICNTCRRGGGQRRAVMNDRGYRIEHAAHAMWSAGVWLFSRFHCRFCSLFYCNLRDLKHKHNTWFSLNHWQHTSLDSCTVKVCD